jgi:hypothetical protein
MSMSEVVKFINLTPHEVVLYDETAQNVILKIPPSGKVARVSVKSEIVGNIDGVPIRRTTYGDIQDLPDPLPNTVYIVSTVLLIALQAKGIRRTDVVSPDTNPDSVIRDTNGRVMGVKYFQVI